MEVTRWLGSSKGQLMSLAVTVFIMLMASALLLYVIVGLGYDSVTQSSVVSSSSINYGTILQKNAVSFATGSASAALHTLFVYEYNASLRKGNLISNFSQFMQYLMVNGTLPNVQPGTPAANKILNLMSNSTFASYNSEISSITNAGSRIITISESKPHIFQANPYSINVQYTEYAKINTTSGIFSFTIPVNASVPINNTPDLFYAQQGIFRPMAFAGLSNLVSVIGNDYATYGNTSSFTYGTAYVIPSPASCTSPVNLVPSPLNSHPYNSMLIIVTANAVALTSGGCTTLNAYGGLITNLLSTPPPVPYLNFSTTNNALKYLQTGQHLLLYGPSLAALNITNLVDKINTQSSNYAITIDNVPKQSAAYFSGSASSYIKANAASLPIGSAARTLTAWISMASDGQNIGAVGYGGTSASLQIFDIGVYPSDTVFFWGSGDDCQSNLVVQTNTWTFIAVTYLAGANTVTLYDNGSSQTCNLSGGVPLNTPAGTQFSIGVGLSTNSYPFPGKIANIQVYNKSLSSQQVYQLYQEGIGGAPLPASGLVGWWPLNGNANGYANQYTAGYPLNAPFQPVSYNSVSFQNSYSVTSQSVPIPLLNYSKGAYKLYNVGIYSWK